MPDENDYAQLSELLSQCLRLLKKYVGAGDDAALLQSEEWKYCFGNDNVVSVLNKLVAMYKSLCEQQRAMEKEKVQIPLIDDEPMSDTEWEFLEQCVMRWREGREERSSGD